MQLQFNGFATSTEPPSGEDVALVIRADGRVEAFIPSVDGTNRPVAGSVEAVRAVYALMLVAAQEGVMNAALNDVDAKVADAMKLRVVN